MSGKKRKGLSADEKRSSLLSIYHDKKEPFNLKEIESLGAKAGVVQQTIKDVNQSLVDDNLVLSDRIGSANFFWSFPSKAYQDQVSTRGTLLERIQLTEKSVANIEEEINVAKRSRCAADRGSKLKALEDLASRERALDQQLEVFRFNDPAEIQKIDDQADASRGAANRWTDNIYVLRSFLVKKKGMGSKEVDGLLKINGGFDYVS